MARAPELSRITTPTELDELFNASLDQPVWLFKHSLICPTSERAWEEFQEFSTEVSGASIGVVEIQRARDISREVANRTGVRHESPQVLLIREGLPVWHASHWDITRDSLASAAAAHVAAETEVPS